MPAPSQSVAERSGETTATTVTSPLGRRPRIWLLPAFLPVPLGLMGWSPHLQCPQPVICYHFRIKKRTFILANSD